MILFNTNKCKDILMLSKNQIKLIKSLSQKKFREQHGLFTVEGIKGITEFLNSSYKLNHIYTTEAVFDCPEDLYSLVSEADLKRISNLKSPNTALAVFRVGEEQALPTSGLIVALDAVRDPGNLGTIIRLCDWFGIRDLVCSKTTVDCYNSKVVQASMGSLTRVNIHYTDLDDFVKTSTLTTFGTFLDGDHIYATNLPSEGIIILGNEANGISDDLAGYLDKRITIPQFGNLKATESLNVATATAIILSEFKRAQ